MEKEKTIALPAELARVRVFSRLDVIFISSLLILVAGLSVGFLGGLGNNAECFRFIGCNAGFFGYDAFFEHFLAGGFTAVFAVWLMKRHARINVLSEDFLKNIIMLIAVVALVGVSWEIMEFSHDALVHAGLLANPLLLPHSIFQPTNSDTMGDLVFDLLGGVLAIAVMWKADRTVLAPREN